MTIMAFQRATRRVVVTGVGMVTPLGPTTPQTWEGLLSGRCGIRKLTVNDIPGVSALRMQIGGKVERNFSGSSLVRQIKLGDNFIFACAVAPTHEALEDAKWSPATEEEKLRAGIIAGSAFGPLSKTLESGSISHKKGYGRVDRLFLLKSYMNVAAGGLSIMKGLKGWTHTHYESSCSGQIAVGDAFRVIQRGSADVMVAVAADETLQPFLLSGYSNLGSLNVEDNENPLTSSRPFDRSRKGQVLAEGGCALVLEELEHAVSRNARIYAEIKGHATAFDPQSLTRQSEEGDGLRRAIKLALERAGKRPEEVDLIFAQGSGTENGDISEANALVGAFGSKGPAITTMKGHLGDMLAPGSSIEVAAAALAIHHGQVPGILNLKNPLSVGGVVPNFATETFKFSPNTILATSYGLGGINSALILSKLV